MKESQLWKYLKQNLPGHLVRIENCLEPGTPDVNGCIEGVEFWLELKVNNNQVSSIQKVWHFKRSTCGGRVFIVDLTKSTLSVFRVGELMFVISKIREYKYPLKDEDWEDLTEALTG